MDISLKPMSHSKHKRRRNYVLNTNQKPMTGYNSRSRNESKDMALSSYKYNRSLWESQLLNRNKIHSIRPDFKFNQSQFHLFDSLPNRSRGQFTRFSDETMLTKFIESKIKFLVFLLLEQRERILNQINVKYKQKAKVRRNEPIKAVNKMSNDNQNNLSIINQVFCLIK